jgi:hypothetical protein
VFEKKICKRNNCPHTIPRRKKRIEEKENTEIKKLTTFVPKKRQMTGAWTYSVHKVPVEVVLAEQLGLNIHPKFL